MAWSNVALLDTPTNANGVCRDISKQDESRSNTTTFITSDPRPDLVDDSAGWQQLLVIAADALDEADVLFGTLLGFRSCGAGLVQDARGNWRIAPGEMSEDEYRQDRETWLMLRRREVGELLRRLQIGGV